MLWREKHLNPSVSLREPAPLRTGELSFGLKKFPNAEGDGGGDRPRLVSVKRTTGTERPGASLFERKARVCDASSGVQGVSSEADAALIFWFFCIKAKERSSFENITGLKILILNTIGLQIRLNRIQGYPV